MGCSKLSAEHVYLGNKQNAGVTKENREETQNKGRKTVLPWGFGGNKESRCI